MSTTVTTPDQQRIAQADQAAHQHVAAELIRTQRMIPGPFVAEKDRRHELVLHHHLGRTDRGHLGIDGRGQHQRNEDEEADLEARHAPGGGHDAAVDRTDWGRRQGGLLGDDRGGRHAQISTRGSIR
ncbi:hypothetical protein ABIF15_007420 [Bradyrhizobium elkanii]